MRSLLVKLAPADIINFSHDHDPITSSHRLMRINDHQVMRMDDHQRMKTNDEEGRKGEDWEQWYEAMCSDTRIAGAVHTWDSLHPRAVYT